MLILSFFLASAVLFLQGVDLPSISINAYIPWIAITILRAPKQKNFLKPLFGSAGAGILLDLLSDSPLGLYPICYTVTAAFFFRFRNRFHYDQPLQLALFSSLLSLFTSGVQIFILFLFDRRVPLSGEWFLINWLSSSLIDGIYSLLWFSGPLYLWIKASRYWTLFWLKKKHSPA
jgi:rod shape-determining protein MreD